MTKETCVHFIRGCTGDDVKIGDTRIATIFNTYNRAKDGHLTRAEFIGFFKTAGSGNTKTIYDNLRHHNV